MIDTITFFYSLKLQMSKDAQIEMRSPLCCRRYFIRGPRVSCIQMFDLTRNRGRHHTAAARRHRTIQPPSSRSLPYIRRLIEMSAFIQCNLTSWLYTIFHCHSIPVGGIKNSNEPTAKVAAFKRGSSRTIRISNRQGWF